MIRGAPHNIALVVLAVLLCGAALAQRRPPNYSLDDMPATNFDCRDKSIGGYYADPEADCQMFHVCVKMADNQVQDFRFLCPNDTMFDQENQICANWFDIDCEANTLYYAKGFDLLRLGHGVANEDLLQKTPLVPERRLPVVQRPRQREEQELFRGASSSDIHRGRDEEDEEFERQNKKKAKVVGRRKQQGGRARRPLVTTTEAPEEYVTLLTETFAEQPAAPEYTSINRNNNQAVTAAPSSTTTFSKPTQPQRVQQNVTPQRNNFQINVAPNNRPGERIQQRIPNNNEFQRAPQRNNLNTPAPNADVPRSQTRNNDFQRTPVNNEAQRTPVNNDFQRTPANNNNNNFQRTPANNNFQRAPVNNEPQRTPANNDFQRTPANNNFQRTPVNNEPQRTPANNNFQRTPVNNEPQRTPANNDFQRTPVNNDFQRTQQRNNFQQPQQQSNNNEPQRTRGSFRNQQRNNFVTPPPQNNERTTFQASSPAPIAQSTFQQNFSPVSNNQQNQGFSSQQNFVSTTITPTTYSRPNNFNTANTEEVSTISPTTYAAFQQRKNQQRQKFSSTPLPNSISNQPTRSFASTPAPFAVSAFTPDVTPRPNQNQQFAPTTYRPRQQNNVPQPFQQRRAQRPRDDFNREPEELLNTAHSSSFRASDLNAIQKSTSFPSSTPSTFPPPSSPRSFTAPRQQTRQRGPTTAQPLNNQQNFDNRRGQQSTFVNNPSSPAPFSKISTVAEFNPSTVNSFASTPQQNQFNPSSPKPNNFQAQNNNFFNPSTVRPSQQNFNTPTTFRPNNFNNQQNFNNNPSSPARPNNFNNQQNFNNNPSTGRPINNENPTQNNFFNPSTQSPRGSSPNNFFNPSTQSPARSSTFFNNPSTPQQFTGSVVSSTPQPFSRVQRPQNTPNFQNDAPKSQQPQASFVSTPQPFQQRPAENNGKPNKPAHKKANSDYDYAYYDDSPADDYEGVEHIGEFTKTHNTKG